MVPAMSIEDPSRRVIVTHAPPSAFAPTTRPILARLGYRLLESEDFSARFERDEDLQPDLRIVDERQLGELDEGDEPTAPIVLLTGRHGATGADPRIVGALQRPAGIHELYRLVQQLLEERPRSSPRVPTHLRARCSRDGREWTGALLSLSENGGLVRSSEPTVLGSRLRLAFELPHGVGIEVDGDVAYQLLPDLGIVFSGTPAPVREAIAAYVREALAASP